MNRSEAEKRIKKLRNEIAQLRNEYHVLDNPSVTDDVYDSLNRELRVLIAEYPEFNDPNAPENRVGGKALDKFVKVKHKIRMTSLNDVFSEKELFDWENRIKKLLPPATQGYPVIHRVTLCSYFCEVKFDGLAVSLTYEKGKFIHGSTRGDGLVGEDITENLKTIQSIPMQLNSPFPEFTEVRGEAIMAKKTLIWLNKKNEKEGKPLFANTRNAAAGSLRQLDSKLTAERKLDFFAYDIAEIKFAKPESFRAGLAGVGAPENRGPEKTLMALQTLKTHSEKHALLKKLGFMVDDNEKICKNISEVITFIRKFEKIRPNFPYGTDGVVISVDDLKMQETLGIVGKAPRYMAAFKYPAERATTIIKDIKVNVGRTGVLTPLAIFEPTLVAGSMVAKATLHNMDQIARLDVRIGDTVVIEKAGDVIPKVVEVLPKMRTGKEKKFKIPEKCPVCGAKVEKKESGIKQSPVSNGLAGVWGPGEPRTLRRGALLDSGNLSVAYYCTNPKCPAKNERFLEHFVTAFEIYELGPKILRRFKDEGLISDAADIFTLNKEDIAPLERFGEKSAENIVKEIENKKKIPFSRFLWALGILHVGEETARDLASNFGTLEKLEKASLEEINDIENIGPAVSESVYNFFRDKNNLNFIEKLLKNGVILEKVQKRMEGKFRGLVFVLTGTLSTLSRELAKEKIINLGGKVSGSVSQNTSYVIAGEEAGSKLKNAEKLGVKVIGEKEFLEML